MSSLEYVCVSDLHLGARDSILTHVDDCALDTEPNHRRVGATLADFATALRQQIRHMSPASPPTLVLLGDALDMAFSPLGCAALGFQRFLEALFADDGEPVFADSIIVVPGNHDHHLWTMAKDRLFLDTLTNGGHDAGAPVPARRHTTSLFCAPHVRSSFLSELAGGATQGRNIEVRLAYPNFGLVTPERSRAVVLHHGHFTESLYCLMSAFTHWLDPGTEATTVEQLESQNGPWIDFLWSSFGDAGALGSEASLLYETMQNPAAARVRSQDLAKRLTTAAMGLVPMHGLADVKLLTRRLVEALVDVSLGRVGDIERNSYGAVLSDGGKDGLQRYLAGPVMAQIKDELDGQIPAALTFVFGHTHKPFEDFVLSADDACGPALVHTYNTGGWVLDEPRMPEAQGASAIFIDDELHVAALRLFNSPLNETQVPVHVRTCGPADGFANAVDDALTKSREAWSTFSETAAYTVQARSQQMARRFFDARANPDGVNARGAVR